MNGADRPGGGRSREAAEQRAGSLRPRTKKAGGRKRPPGFDLPPSPGRPGVDHRYAMITLRGNCSWASRNVILSPSSSAVGCTAPVTSVTRETTVCSPGAAPSQR